MTDALVPKVPPGSEETARHRRAHDRLADHLNALITAGVFTVVGGAVVVDLAALTGPAGADGADADFTLAAGIARCKNALRFLGVEPNDFPAEDLFPGNPQEDGA